MLEMSNIKRSKVVSPSSASPIRKDFPRRDKKFRTHSSIDFKTKESNIYSKTNIDNDQTKLQIWAAYCILGICVGVVAWTIDIIVDNLVKWKWSIAQMIITKESPVGLSMMTFLAFGCLFGGIASLLTVFVAPGAAGSGIAELMAYLNGINYP